MMGKIGNHLFEPEDSHLCCYMDKIVPDIDQMNSLEQLDLLDILVLGYS